MVKEKMSGVSTIRSKLIAAIAMLLVGVFMIVSSSYAWFTLSTAPEVTGIYTSVGANGNLEMALVPADGDLNKITSGVGDSGKNETWGNLVDLGQTTGNQNNYGLDKIQLLPSKLAVTSSTNEDYDYAYSSLKAPVYGADGRVESLVPTVHGDYSTGKWVQNSDAHGVVAIGSASGMSLQQTAWLEYKRALNANLAEAQNKADKTFENYGSPLANVVMTKAMQGDGAKYDIAFVGNMLTELEAANALLADAAEQYFAAKAAETLYDLDDATWNIVTSELAALDFASLPADATSAQLNGQAVPFDATLTKVMAQYNEIKTKLADTRDAWTAFNGTATAATWTEASAILISTHFLVYEQILVNGKTTAEIKNMMGENFSTSQIPQELLDFGMAFVNNGIVDFTSGSGVHADFAEVVGEYQAEIAVTMSLNDTSFTNPSVKLRTIVDSDGERVDMSATLSQPLDNTSGSAEKPLTDYYGYKLDFAFRTNAKGSSLMLQTDATGRVYTDGTEETMGNGSSMTFTILDDTFTQDQAKKLMTAVRIVFIDKAGNIVALGLLEQTVTNNNAYEISANGEITSYITLYNFEITDDVLVIGTQKVPNEKGQTALMELTQNEATQLSALVYLDGDIVDNSMVSAGTVASISGSLNLQFSSSADLQPMDYTEFMGSDETSTEATGN